MKIYFRILLIISILLSSIPLPAQQQVRNGKMAVTGAKVRLKHKKYDEALEILEQGKVVEPDYAELYPLLGSLYIRFEEYAKADSAFKKAVRLDPKFHEECEQEKFKAWSMLFDLGVKAMKEEDLGEAITHFTNATVIYSERPDAYINLGALYIKASKKDDEWIAGFLKAQGSIDTTTMGAPISNVLIRKAAENYFQVRLIDPMDFAAISSLANIYDYLERPDSAKIFYKEALILEPEDLSIQEALATCYRREGSLDSARALYEILLQADEVKPHVAFNAGLLQLQKENWPGVEKAMNIVVQDNPKDSEALKYLVTAMREQSKYVEVVSYLEKILEFDESNKEAWRSLHVTYSDLGMKDKADMALKKYEELVGDENMKSLD